MQQLATIEPGTHPAVRDRIPEIMELLADDVPVCEIADRLGVHRTTVWRSLQRVDFAPIVNMLVTDIVSDIAEVADPYKRAYLRSYFLGKIHSKKTRGELTVTRHTINEERRTARLELDMLSADEQRTLIRLQKKMRVVDADHEPL